MLRQEIKNQIVARLTERLKLHKIILFGSHVTGFPGTDSDVDLIVVTDDDFIPANFEENMRHYLRVSSVLIEIKKKIPIDLIVHTRPMHERFLQLGSMFSREVARTGEVLYEKSD